VLGLVAAYLLGREGATRAPMPLTVEEANEEVEAKHVRPAPAPEARKQPSLEGRKPPEPTRRKRGLPPPKDPRPVPKLGRVVDIAGRGMVGVRMSFDPPRGTYPRGMDWIRRQCAARSGADGWFDVPSGPDRSFFIDARHEDHIDYYTDSWVLKGAPPHLEIVMHKLTRIGGRVADQNGEPWAGELVTSRHVGSGKIREDKTDSKGEWALIVPPGEHDITIGKAAAPLGTDSLYAKEGGFGVSIIRPDSDRFVRGKFETDAKDRFWLFKVRMYLLKANGADIDAAHPDATTGAIKSGAAFSFPLPPRHGGYLLTIHQQRADLPLEVLKPLHRGRSGLRVALARSAGATGVVRGRIAPATEVEKRVARLSGPRGLRVEVAIDPAGLFVFTDVPPGTDYTLSVERAGRRVLTRSKLTVTAAGRVDLGLLQTQR
jgi:hypothetical protein